MEMSEIAPLPRLCVLVKNATGDEFGFNLVGRNDSSEGRYIGQVDANGIAEAAGLLQGDEIITVNGKDVTSWSHTQVVNEIKTNPLTTQLLVISQKGYEWYQQRHMAVPTVIPSDKQICIIESALPNDSGLSDMNDTIGDSSEIEEKTVSLETDRTEVKSQHSLLL